MRPQLLPKMKELNTTYNTYGNRFDDMINKFDDYKPKKTTVFSEILATVREEYKATATLDSHFDKVELHNATRQELLSDKISFQGVGMGMKIEGKQKPIQITSLDLAPEFTLIKNLTQGALKEKRDHLLDNSGFRKDLNEHNKAKINRELERHGKSSKTNDYENAGKNPDLAWYPDVGILPFDQVVMHADSPIKVLNVLANAALKDNSKLWTISKEVSDLYQDLKLNIPPEFAQLALEKIQELGGHNITEDEDDNKLNRLDFKDHFYDVNQWFNPAYESYEKTAKKPPSKEYILEALLNQMVIFSQLASNLGLCCPTCDAGKVDPQASVVKTAQDGQNIQSTYKSQLDETKITIATEKGNKNIETTLTNISPHIKDILDGLESKESYLQNFQAFLNSFTELTHSDLEHHTQLLNYILTILDILNDYNEKNSLTKSIEVLKNMAKNLTTAIVERFNAEFPTTNNISPEILEDKTSSYHNRSNIANIIGHAVASIGYTKFTENKSLKPFFKTALECNTYDEAQKEMLLQFRVQSTKSKTARYDPRFSFADRLNRALKPLEVVMLTGFYSAGKTTLTQSLREKWKDTMYLSSNVEPTEVTYDFEQGEGHTTTANKLLVIASSDFQEALECKKIYPIQQSGDAKVSTSENGHVSNDCTCCSGRRPEQERYHDIATNPKYHNKDIILKDGQGGADTGGELNLAKALTGNIMYKKVLHVLDPYDPKWKELHEKYAIYEQDNNKGKKNFEEYLKGLEENETNDSEKQKIAMLRIYLVQFIGNTHILMNTWGEGKNLAITNGDIEKLAKAANDSQNYNVAIAELDAKQDVINNNNKWAEFYDKKQKVNLAEIPTEYFEPEGEMKQMGLKAQAYDLNKMNPEQIKYFLGQLDQKKECITRVKGTYNGHTVERKTDGTWKRVSIKDNDQGKTANSFKELKI